MIYYFVRVSLGAFTKGLGFGDLRPNLIALAVFIPVLRRSVFCFCASRSGEAPRMCMVANIFWLGTKEIRSFLRDFVMLGLVIYTFSLAIIAQSQSNAQELHNAASRRPSTALVSSQAGVPFVQRLDLHRQGRDLGFLRIRQHRAFIEGFRQLGQLRFLVGHDALGFAQSGIAAVFHRPGLLRGPG
jgi:hypothetical protein